MSSSPSWQTLTERAARRSRNDDLAGALGDYTLALSDAALAGPQRAHVMAKLAEVQRLAVGLEAAESTARAARELAAGAQDDHSHAHAGFSLATVLLGRFEDSGEEGYLEEALALLDESATLYERLERMDFGTVLLTLGETLGKMGELESAAGVLSRALEQISQPRWLENAEGERHILGVQGRIRASLGFVFLEQELTEPASEQLRTAAERLLEARDVTSLPLLETIAQTLADELLDGSAAEGIRRRARLLAIV